MSTAAAACANLALSSSRVRVSALKAAFERLCLENAEFLRSLESTTKSLDATSTRLELWGDEMHKVFGAKVKVARYSDGKISSS